MNRLGNKGQSLVELVFAIGVVGLVMAGALVLLVNSLSSQSKKFDHKKASDLAAVVTEDMMALKENNPQAFWGFTSVSGQTNPEFPGYTYDISFSPVTTGGKCANTPLQCANVNVKVTWNADTTKTLTATRFYSRN